MSDTNNVREDPDGEDQGSEFTAEDGGEIRSRELREFGYCEYLQRRQAALWSMLQQQDDANAEKYDRVQAVFSLGSVRGVIFFSTCDSISISV